LTECDVDERTHLLIAAREGDHDALAELVNGLLPHVWRFCASMVGPADADDAAQETFVRVWRSATTFRAESAAMTWVLAIARRVCIDLAKRRNADVRPLAGADAPDPRDHAAAQALDDLIARLAPDRRAAFVLTQVLGLSYEQAAQVCGCPVGTIRSRVARARADLFAAAADPPASATGEPG
jgi:RNA polymerase sigma-70 factor (ECF subfamily)